MEDFFRYAATRQMISRLLNNIHNNHSCLQGEQITFSFVEEKSLCV